MTLLVTAECVDDLINDVHQAILADGLSNDPTKGSTLEILGAYLVLTDPRRRISRTESRGKLISCLGEFLWYLSAQNDLEFIKTSYHVTLNPLSQMGKYMVVTGHGCLICVVYIIS